MKPVEMVSDREVVECLRELLSTSDLARTTISNVRHKLEEDLGIDLSDRKAFIREQIDLYFRTQIPETEESNDDDNEGEEGDKMEYSNGKSRNILRDGDRKRYKAFDCGAPGSSNGHINVVGLSESMPPAENKSTSDYVDNDTLGTQNQQHERETSSKQAVGKSVNVLYRETSSRKMSRRSTKACKIAQEDGSGSKQPCKKRKITTTTPAQPTPPSPAHRTFEQDHSKSDKQPKDEEKDEADEEDIDEQQLPTEENLKGRNPRKSGVDRKSGKNVPFAVTVTDQDVFDCPVCFEKLTNNVYQCKNGHIACDSCRVKINKICPTCSFPIRYRCRAFEKVLEAIQLPCVNAEHGCQQVISYSKIRDHEGLCAYLPCSCPIRKCDFKGTGSNLYQHFDEKHEAVNFRFKYRVSVSLKREKRFIVLREKASGTLFVVKLFRVPQGKVISVVLIGPKSYSGKYRYELTAKDDGVTPPIAMHSPVESIPRLADYHPTKYFLVVEDGISQLNFDIRIRPNQ